MANLEPPQALIDAARKEGLVNLYTSMNANLTRAFLNAFEKRYGIKGSFFRAPTVPLLQRFAAEHDGNGVVADVFSVSSPLPFAQHADWFAPLDPAAEPNLKNWPQRGVHKVSFTWTNEILALAYNTDEVKGADVPRVWTDALNPKWKGRIVLSDPRAADNYMGWLDAIESAHGADFLKKLATMDFKLTPSGASGVQLVAAGSVAMNFPTIGSFAAPLIAKKAPIAIVYPEEPQLASARDAAIVAKAPHRQAARLYLNWTMSLEATQLYCRLSPVAIVGDPEGKAGCLPSQKAHEVKFDVSKDRAHALTRDLGLNQ
jgi:iron(III) transport system substrate-binding protein